MVVVAVTGVVLVAVKLSVYSGVKVVVVVICVSRQVHTEPMNARCKTSMLEKALACLCPLDEVVAVADGLAVAGRVTDLVVVHEDDFVVVDKMAGLVEEFEDKPRLCATEATVVVTVVAVCRYCQQEVDAAARVWGKYARCACCRRCLR